MQATTADIKHARSVLANGAKRQKTYHDGLAARAAAGDACAIQLQQRSRGRVGFARFKPAQLRDSFAAASWGSRGSTLLPNRRSLQHPFNSADQDKIQKECCNPVLSAAPHLFW